MASCDWYSIKWNKVFVLRYFVCTPNIYIGKLHQPLLNFREITLFKID